MARAFGNADFLVYGETAVTIDSKEKVDLVAIHPHTGTGVVAWWTSEDAEHEHLDSLWTSLQRNSAKGDAHWDVFPLSNDPAVQTLNTG